MKIDIDLYQGETVIYWDYMGNMAALKTTSVAVMRKLDKLCATSPGDYQEIREKRVMRDGELFGKEYRFTKRLLVFSGSPGRG